MNFDKKAKTQTKQKMNIEPAILKKMFWLKHPNVLLTIILLTINILTINISLAEDPPPPPPSEHGTSGNVSGRGAPIDGGVSLLIILGAAYGGKKYYSYRKKLKHEMED